MPFGVASLHGGFAPGNIRFVKQHIVGKRDLWTATGMNSSSIARLSKNDNVSMGILIKVFTTLDIGFDDLMELVPDTE